MVTGAGTHDEYEPDEDSVLKRINPWPMVWRRIPNTRAAWEMVRIPPEEAPDDGPVDYSRKD